MIKLSMIRKSYGDKEVLKGVTLEVQKHELLCLVGPNGSGKTTTLNIVAGLCQPEEGTVFINDTLMDGRSGKRLVHVSPSERKIGYVFQDYALFPHMTVRENISYGLRARHMQKQEVKERTNALLEFVGLRDHSEHYPHQLSGGQRQKTALARALAIEPEILLLDEPLAALDLKTRELLRVELKKILGTLEVTSIYVTHELAEAYIISDRIAVMGPGRIEQTGPREEVFSRPNEYVAQFLGQKSYNGNDSLPVAQSTALSHSGVKD
jgi:ABC-type Fe3+/spermidine/putrescine transport system ATPase subunit